MSIEKVGKIVRVLRGCVSASTAYVQRDYPYGRELRCQRRVWLEYKPRFGYRVVTQTTDPKKAFEKWNKPHAGQYHHLEVLVLTDEHTHEGEPTSVRGIAIGPDSSEDDLAAFMTAFGQDLDAVACKLAHDLSILIPRFGTKATGRRYVLRDLETGDLLLEGRAVEASHPTFVGSWPVQGDDLDRGAPTWGRTAAATELAKYNPPLRYVDETRPRCAIACPMLGRRVLIELAACSCDWDRDPERATKLHALDCGVRGVQQVGAPS